MSKRLNLLKKTYTRMKKDNERYEELLKELTDVKEILIDLDKLSEECKILNSVILSTEEMWRDAMLRKIEEEISWALSVVFPSDGYEVSLGVRTLRGKLHLSATVTSFNIPNSSLVIKKTQGRLFQQVVSIASVIAIMDMLGVRTIYIDEAFSGASPSNITLAGDMLMAWVERGFNLVIIAQNLNIIRSADANIFRLSRTAYNQTIIEQGGVQFE